MLKIDHYTALLHGDIELFFSCNDWEQELILTRMILCEKLCKHFADVMDCLLERLEVPTLMDLEARLKFEDIHAIRINDCSLYALACKTHDYYLANTIDAYGGIPISLFEEHVYKHALNHGNVELLQDIDRIVRENSRKRGVRYLPGEYPCYLFHSSRYSKPERLPEINLSIPDLPIDAVPSVEPIDFEAPFAKMHSPFDFLVGDY